MVRQSPSPRRRSRRPWRWVLLGFVACIVIGFAGLAAYPLWAGDLVRDALIERLAQRLGGSATIAELELGYTHVRIHQLELDAGPQIALARIDVDLDPAKLWRGRAEVERVEVHGGKVEGARTELEDLAVRLIGQRREADASSTGRVRVLPAELHIDTLRVVLHDAGGQGQGRSLDAWVAVDAEPRDHRAKITLTQVRAQLEEGPPLRAARVAVELEVERTDGPLGPAFPLTIELDGGAAAITPQIALADVEGTVTLSDASWSEIDVGLEGGFADARDEGPAGDEALKLWSVKGKVRRDLSEGRLRVEMESFELGRVPQVLAALPLSDSEDATVGGHVALVFGDGKAHLEGDVALAGLNVSHDLLARDVVRDLGFDLRFAAELDPHQRKLVIHQARFERRGVALEVEGSFVHSVEREGRRYSIRARMPPVSCQSTLAAIPKQLVPSLDGFTLDGTFELDVHLDVDYADLDGLDLGGKVGIWNCRVLEVPSPVSAERLGGPFTHRVAMRDGRHRIVRLYTGSGTFTPLHRISPHMVSAVLTTEDGGFRRHRGFLPSQFEEALRRNLKAGRVRLGASTITMQMIKNVLLSHERTLSRKLQEMFLTWYVETRLSKNRIMEIYLNIVELGPGIYGVTRAADHYFGKHPEELTPPEAAWLALMLPSPVRRHGHYCRGVVSPRYTVKLRRILRIMHGRKRLSDEDYELWKETELEFDLSERRSVDDCLGEINRLLEASKGQRALSGLLASGGSDESAPEPGPDPQADAEDPDRLPSLDDPDPAQSDAPGQPAMDPFPGAEEGEGDGL